MVQCYAILFNYCILYFKVTNEQKPIISVINLEIRIRTRLNSETSTYFPHIQTQNIPYHNQGNANKKQNEIFAALFTHNKTQRYNNNYLHCNIFFSNIRSIVSEYLLQEVHPGLWILLFSSIK